MLTGGIEGYPDAVIIVEVQEEPVTPDQKMVHAVPRLYSSINGPLLATLPFDSTATTIDTDSVRMVEEAMQAWKAFRHMERVQ